MVEQVKHDSEYSEYIQKEKDKAKRYVDYIRKRCVELDIKAKYVTKACDFVEGQIQYMFADMDSKTSINILDSLYQLVESIYTYQEYENVKVSEDVIKKLKITKLEDLTVEDILAIQQ
jgi:hypothetical protein